ncbi:tetratricopeptide repeat protein [Streptomyces sp. YIM B13518]|uniref:tetratricopeptide repeat protein n=1 Tax=Streptomyces sp. YIM B13518 TaxID=3366316 RepID=UPI0036B604DB
MVRARLSMQQIVQRRRRAGIVGRGAERELFRANFDIPPEDERHRFLFHVHGTPGVGKTRLLKEFEHIARERGALTVYVDESAGGVPEALEEMCRQSAAQGSRFKELERLLADHRERRHEAESAALAALDPEPASGPSAGGMAVARAGLAGLGLVPGLGAFTGVLDPTQLAQGADRLRAGLSARFRSYEDVQLVLSPESVLTPVLANELHGAASGAPWIVLFFDTYERTGPFLDAWLHDLLTTDRYGTLPATVVVVTAGQLPLDTARWSGFADFTTVLPLWPFTEAEARGLLADRGITAEPVVTEVLRLTGGLPVLVSTLAASRPARPQDVHDPSATAVERFLRWEQDPVRRAAALAGALPRLLDADVFHVAAAARGELPDGLYEWVSTLPFTVESAGRLRYHDVVRAPMLRLQRGRSPRGWAESQQRLAEAFRRWREESEAGRGAVELWADPDWRELRLAESYHLLCGGGRQSLSEVLRDLVEACDQGESVAGQWVGLLTEAGRDAGLDVVGRWGNDLSGALGQGGTGAVLELLVESVQRRRLRWNDEVRAPVTPGWSRPSRDVPAGTAGGAEPFDGDRARDVPAGTAPGGTGAGAGPLEEEPFDEEFFRSVPLDGEPLDGEPLDGEPLDGERTVPVPVPVPVAAAGAEAEAGDWPDELPPETRLRVHRIRAEALAVRGDYGAAAVHMGLAGNLAPDDPGIIAARGEYLRAFGRFEPALAALLRAVRLDPDHAYAWASLGATHLALGDPEAALSALDHALELKPDYPWALVRRARVWRELDEPERRLADLDRAVVLQPDSPWAHCERGDALRSAGRDEEALTAYDLALALDPGYASAYASRGVSRFNLGRRTEALADLDRALELDPSYAWARTQRDAVARHPDG